jgi:hypothetical protein
MIDENSVGLGTPADCEYGLGSGFHDFIFSSPLACRYKPPRLLANRGQRFQADSLRNGELCEVAAPSHYRAITVRIFACRSRDLQGSHNMAKPLHVVAIKKDS